MRTKIATLEAKHIAAIYKIAALIDAGADKKLIESVRTERDCLKTKIRSTLFNFDRGYT